VSILMVCGLQVLQVSHYFLALFLHCFNSRLILPLLKIAVFWDVTPCSPRRNAVSFMRNVLPPLKCKPSTKPAISGRQLELTLCCLLLAPLLLAPDFDPEDGGSTFLRNDGEVLDYTVLHP
jgi:hypothetical protein